MKVLITGIAGFVGSHLADYLLTKENIELFGIERKGCHKENIKDIQDKINFIECDIKDVSSIKRILENVKPDRIFHLAAQSFVSDSWDTPAETLNANIIGTLNIFEAIKELKLSAGIMIPGSSDEYGLVDEKELPIKETNSLRPLSPYAVSKIGQDFLAYQYYKSYGLHTVRLRVFKHTGPRRAEAFVCSNFAKQIVEIKKGHSKPVVYVGNLDVKRDFTDVRDIVKAYWLALEHCEPGEVYNLCSGKAYSIKEVLDKLISIAGVDVEIKQDKNKTRPSDVSVLVGDCSKFKEKTGWQPEIPFDQTLKDLLSYWCQVLT